MKAIQQVISFESLRKKICRVKREREKKETKDKKTERQEDKKARRFWSLEYSTFDVALLLLFGWDSLKTYI